MPWIVTINNHALAFADTREEAEADAIARRNKYIRADELAGQELFFEHHWAGQYRLQSRPVGKKRSSWTLYGIIEIPRVGEEA